MQDDLYYDYGLAFSCNLDWSIECRKCLLQCVNVWGVWIVSLECIAYHYYHYRLTILTGAVGPDDILRASGRDLPYYPANGPFQPLWTHRQGGVELPEVTYALDYVKPKYLRSR